VSAAREEILRRVRAAKPPTAGPIPRDYRRHGTLDHEERVALFCERVGEYRAEVHRCAEDEVADLIASMGRKLVTDDRLSVQELDEVDGALTGCTVAIAETGTIVLTEGRRALTLVPDLHVCVVKESQIVQLLPEALARIDPRRPITFVSGPSATSDIELSRVEGVHGPRNLVVLVVKEAS
jgi:L-lactate dehydrogenase complex protein LldG